MIRPSSAPPIRRRAAARRLNSFRPRLEALEDRAVPTGVPWAIDADPEGYVYHDFNGNGVFDAGESAVGAGWTVYGDANADGLFNSGEISTTTDATGHYSLVLPDGTYSIRVLPQSGYQDDARPLGTVDNDFASVESGIVNGSNNYSGLAWVNGSLYQTFKISHLMYQIDPQTGATLGSPVTIPDNVFEITFDGTDFWGASPAYPTGDLIRFNFAGQELQRLSFTNMRPNSVEWDGSALRVLDGATNRIYRIDPSGSGTILDYINAPNENVGGLAFDGTDLWINGRETDRVYALDPASGAIQRSFAHHGDLAFGLAIYGQHIWLSDNQLSRDFQYDLGFGGGRIVTVAGADVTGVNLAVSQPASISGRVFNDNNQNSVQDASDGGLEGWRVYVDANADGQYNPWETSVITDTAGNFALNGLQPGTYAVTLSPRQPGWSPTTPQSMTVTVSSGQAASISGGFGQHLAGVGPIGPEKRVNTTTTGIQATQIFPANYVVVANLNAVASDGQGNAVVVWSGNGPGDADGIFAQRYDSAGNPLGTETRLNTATAGSQNSPVVARASTAGTYAAAWDNGYAVSTRLFRADGTAVTGELTVAAASSSTTNFVASIAMDASGDFVILYKQYVQKGFDTSRTWYAQRYNSVGTAQGNAFKVATTNWVGGDHGSVGMDQLGNFVIAWDDAASGSQFIYAQRYNNSGRSVGSRITVNPNPSSGLSQLRSNVAMGAAGDFVVTWAAGSQQYAQMFNANGTPRGGAFTFGATTESPTSIAVQGNGDFVLAWQTAEAGSTSPDPEIRAQRFYAGGVPKESAFPVNTTSIGSQVVPSVAVDGNGSFTIVWNNPVLQPNGSSPQTLVDCDVYRQHYASPPAPLTAAALPATTAAGPLTAAEAKPLLTEALRRWRLAGANTAALGAINLQIADLGGNILGLAQGHTITLDDNADGWGWFVDRTPRSDSEFRDGRDHGQLGHMDALTVLMHEVGHLLGHDHADGGVMTESLLAGVRELPDEMSPRWSVSLHRR